ncbi:NADH dehydrogenase, C subunit [Sphingobacterium spiritivorum ATCC 33300]|uniref:NADH-quinone oxidoreductase subunit C n=1 Tax=Sphingobacterium spiritivorum ATCC 33300 TaxID=525372 RepID=C2G2S5_SPHSI|nr:NADH-quinone oxidoreductase subunit C [Sphingobacterium spiritivorum]EEI90565.1 NADH dehydrogenase, C subunit [Sphingobacterium spiritivorum ATCC 33300]QQS95399.1 NADH-quinone oxidoreductase subunit C [Sphingobacterium spiritivorum]
MTFEDIKTLLIRQFDGSVIVKEQATGLQPALYILPENLVKVCQFLRDCSDTYFDFLSNITAVDDFPADTFTVVYHLASIPYQLQLTLKTELAAVRDLEILPSLPSVSAVWKTAEWHEREAFDLMGIFFTDHPDLRRILLPDDWEGFPLRKDYQDPEQYHGININ